MSAHSLEPAHPANRRSRAARGAVCLLLSVPMSASQASPLPATRLETALQLAQARARPPEPARHRAREPCRAQPPAHPPLGAALTLGRVARRAQVKPARPPLQHDPRHDQVGPSMCGRRAPSRPAQCRAPRAAPANRAPHDPARPPTRPLAARRRCALAHIAVFVLLPRTSTQRPASPCPAPPRAAARASRPARDHPRDPASDCPGRHRSHMPCGALPGTL